MSPFKFKCRAVDIEHSCCHTGEKEPEHPIELLKCVNSVIKATEGMIFSSEIKSSANSNQINSHFDPIWMEKVGTAGWKKTDLSNIRKLHDISNIDIPNIQPDYFLTQGNVTAIIEIEKSNEKTISFDFMKILMFVGPGIVDFGLLLVPRNYAHKTGVWNLFEKARYYRSCLLRFAKVDQNLLSKIAIIGYRQEANISGQWLKLDSSVVINIKKLAQKSA